MVENVRPSFQGGAARLTTGPPAALSEQPAGASGSGEMRHLSDHG